MLVDEDLLIVIDDDGNVYDYSDGYGHTMNVAVDIGLESMSEEDRISYEKELEEENPLAYKGFKQWQERMNSL